MAIIKRAIKRPAYPHVKFTACDSLMRYAEFLGYGNLHIKIDEETGLKAIVAIHNLKRGPAIGGCRILPYPTVDKAIEDALRLARMMSFKAAINNLAHGGGKAVLIKPKIIKDREAYFKKYAEFINELGGRYITAVDSGTSPVEMDMIAKYTSFVTCTSGSDSANDPSPLTAMGVRRGIEAAVKFKLARNSLEGIHVAVQGVGHVGYWLVKDLHERGAKVTISDINAESVRRCMDEFRVSMCAPEEIHQIEADVFSPCALGSVLNRHTINKLKVKIVAGAANNQLSHSHYATLLHERGILYAPDFLINAGGLIHVAVIYAHNDLVRSYEQIDHIYDTVYHVFEQAEAAQCSPNAIAEKIACERLS